MSMLKLATVVFMALFFACVGWMLQLQSTLPVIPDMPDDNLYIRQNPPPDPEKDLKGWTGWVEKRNNFIQEAHAKRVAAYAQKADVSEKTVWGVTIAWLFVSMAVGSYMARLYLRAIRYNR